GRMFTMGNRGDTEYVIALDDADQGKELWAAAVGPVRSTGNRRPGPRCTPTVDGDRVYALGLNGDLLCLEAATGKERWRKDLVKDLDRRMMSRWGYSESPLVDGARLICTPGGIRATLAALNKQSGETIWEAKVPGGDGAAYASAIVAEVNGQRQYIQFVQRGVIGVAAED